MRAVQLIMFADKKWKSVFTLGTEILPMLVTDDHKQTYHVFMFLMSPDRRMSVCVSCYWQTAKSTGLLASKQPKFWSHADVMICLQILQTDIPIHTHCYLSSVVERKSDIICTFNSSIHFHDIKGLHSHVVITLKKIDDQITTFCLFLLHSKVKFVHLFFIDNNFFHIAIFMHYYPMKQFKTIYIYFFCVFD